MRNKTKVFVLSILIAVGIGALSGFLTRGSMDRFEALTKPPLAPPGWLFPVVWGILFILMGISAAIIYLSESPQRTRALKVYTLQLIVNFFWSILFFNLEARLFAFFWLLLLLALVLLMFVLFKRISPTAAYLQIPYILWLLFAAYLNGAIYLLNR
ncbi:MAG: tryptophan-rich sensory protein [Clostridia bacterium]|nr:tryptophan-rich sensory protein [Clostridia bacterium]